MNAAVRHRRALLAAGIAALAAVGCGTPGPPPRLVRLPADAGEASTVAPAAAAVWELAAEVRLPAYLDRETLVVAHSGAAMELLEGIRWAEPLRDAVPRLLRSDLERLRGADRVWLAPLPEPLRAARRLRVELLACHADVAGRVLLLDARWTLADPAGVRPPQAATARLRLPLPGTDAEAIVRAHRTALWQLAERIAASEG